MKDKYAKQVERLTHNPEKIHYEWRNSIGIFQFVGEQCDIKNQAGSCGCLTMIAGDDGFVAPTPELTVAIRADKRIPHTSRKITVESLPVFAEWRRRIDKELAKR